MTPEEQQQFSEAKVALGFANAALRKEQALNAFIRNTMEWQSMAWNQLQNILHQPSDMTAAMLPQWAQAQMDRMAQLEQQVKDLQTKNQLD